MTQLPPRRNGSLSPKNFISSRRRRLLFCLFAIVLSAGLISGVASIRTASTSPVPAAMKQNAQPSVLAPVTATKSATIATDNNGNGHVNPGDVIEYSITVNNGGTPALGVIFSDVLSSDLTLVPGSVKAAPVAGDDSYQAIGNTQLQVAPSQTVSPAVFFNGNVLSNDSDPNGGTLSASAGTTSTNNGTVAMSSDGTFVYTPPVGFTGTDTFSYNLTDTPNDGFTVTGTVTITVAERVWYVSNSALGNDGRSSSPFDTLAQAQTASAAGDTIYVFTGDGTTTGQNSGITLKNNQRLIGAGVALTVPVAVNGGANPTTLAVAGTQPQIGNAGGAGVSVTNLSGVEIRGLNIGASTDAIAASLTAASTVTLNVSNNTIRTAGAQGINLDAGAGTYNVALSSNNVTATGNAIDIAESATGQINITAFNGNTISGTTGGSGVVISGATFDATPGGSFNQIAGGTTAIGSPGDGVGGSGLVLSNVAGDLQFTSLNVYSGGGNGITANGTAAYTGSAGFQLVANSGTDVIQATGGAALNISTANINLTPGSISSSGSTTFGLNLNAVSGTYAAGNGSSISNLGSAAATAYRINGSSVNATYNGTINITQGTGVSLTGNTGTYNFAGALTLSTGANPAFTATGGGTVNVCDDIPCNPSATGTIVNTLTTTTGTALNVANTTIGANELEFRSISSNGAASGIILNSTGSGVLNVTGNGTANSGGTIQNSTGDGISLANAGPVNLTDIRVLTGQSDGIEGSNVAGLSLTRVNVSNNGNEVNERGVFMSGLTGIVTVSNSTFNANSDHNFNVINTSGTLNMAITGSTFSNSSGTFGNDGFLIDANGTSVVTASITGSTFSTNKGDHFQFATNASATSNSNITFSNNTLTNTLPSSIVLGSGVTISPSGSADLKIQLSGNTITDTVSGGAINVNGIGTAVGADIQATITNNTIGQNGVAGSGPEQSGAIQARITGSGTLTSLISNNQIFRWGNGSAIGIENASGSALHYSTVTNNTTLDPESTALRSITVLSGASAGLHDNVTWLELANNNSNTSLGVSDIRLSGSSNSKILMPGYTGGSTDTVAVANFVQGKNPLGGTASAAVGAGAAPFGNTPGGQSVPLPTAPSAPLLMAFNEVPYSEESLLQHASIVNFDDKFYRFPSEALAELAPFAVNSGSESTESTNNSAGEYNDSANFSVSHDSSAAGDFSDAAYRLISAIYNGAKYVVLAEFIPTAHAEESEAAMLAGETVCVDGDATTGPPCNGPGFNLPANKSTTIKFRVTVNASTTATSVSNFANVVAAGGINVNSNTVNTPVVQPPGIAKSFSPTSVAVNGVSTLTLTISNPNPANLTGVAVTDSFPAGMVIAATPTLTTANCGSPTVTDAATGTLAAGDTGIVISGATVAGGTPCVVTVKVIPTSEGDKVNTTGAVTSTNGGTGSTSSATLTAVAAPSFTKSFGAPSIAVGDTTTLTFSITNNSASIPLTNVSFTDTLPAGLAVGTPNSLTGSCGVGAITANAGSGSIQLSGATLAASGNCSFTVDVTGTTAGTKNNSVDLTTDQTGSGPTAADSLGVFVSPDISVGDAKVAEPSTGATSMVFTVTLSETTIQTVTVDFTTAPDTSGANPATSGTDYTTTSGTVTFMPGQSVKTISVPVLADADSPEPGETFLVNLSNATNGDITNGQAVGSITPGDTPGAVLISELRTSGPAGAGDDFVEIYNNSDTPLAIQASDASGGWALVASNNGCTDDPVIVGVIPNGTSIPARGHYLLVGSAYSLANYGGTGAAGGDQALSADLITDANVALFSTADLTQLSTVNQLDAVGFGTNTGGICELLKEGATLVTAAGSTSEHAYVRTYESSGLIVDTNDNASDFDLVSTTPATPVSSNAMAIEGAPGPQNSDSPTDSAPCSDNALERSLLDSSQSESSSPNVVRDTAPGPAATSSLGTLSFRRRFENNTGANLTRLRFRITDLSTSPSSTGTADLRAVTSLDAPGVTIANDPETCGGPTPCTVTVRGTTVETPPAQPNGGGVNSTFTVALGTPLSPGQSVNLQFQFGVQQVGDYNLAMIIEQLPGGGQERWSLHGNTENSSSHSDTGCNEPPETTIDSNPADPSNSNSATFSFSAMDEDGTVASFECRIDSGAFTACTSPQNYTGLADGNHTFVVRAVDNLGAEDPSPASFAWTVDTVEPDTAIDSSPPDPSTGNVSFSFSGTDTGTGVASFECKLDSGTFTSCTSPQAYTGLTGGSHTFSVRAVDQAGNTDSTPASFTWTVDPTPPETTIDTTPANPSNSADAAFTFSSNESGTFECKLDGGSFAACTSPQSYTGVADGSHTFQVRAVDAAGNADATPASYTWVIDTTEPVTQIDSKPPSSTNSNSATFAFSGTDMGGSGIDRFECKLDAEDFAACTSPVTYSTLADGSRTFIVRAVDEAGNVDSTPASWTWTIDTVAPGTAIDSNPANPANSSSSSFTFSGTDTGGTGVNGFECRLDAATFAPCTSPQSYNGLADGSHTFQVRAMDIAGNADATPASYTWTIDTVQPTVTINQAAGQADPALGSGATINFTVVFSEAVTGLANADVVLGGTAGATTAVVSESAPNDGTTFNVAVSGMTVGGTVTAGIPAGAAQDQAGNLNTASTSTDNTVTFVPNRPPTANGDGYSTNEDATLTVAAPGVLGNDTDPDVGDTLTAVLVSGPGHASAFTLNASGSFSYTPASNYFGPDSFSYKARDNNNAESATVTVSLTVNAVNDAPVPSAAPASQTVQYSDAIADVTVSATDVDSLSQTATTAFNVNSGSFGAGLPAGLSISSTPTCSAAGLGSSCQWALTGTMNVAAGSYVVRVTVSDGAGGQANTDVTITVNKEHTATEYTGDDYALTAGPNVSTASVRLAAELTEQADGFPGDITLATVSFQLFKSGNLGSTPDLAVSGVPVDSAGNAITFYNLPVDIWTVKVRIDSTNQYWKAVPVGMGTITVEQATNELRTGGGGWVPDPQSVNGKGNFGFNVASQKKGARGNSVYIFRGLDGFNYLVKSTSWQGGGLGFAKEGQIVSKAAFNGKCVVQKIDPETGEVVASFGNYSFAVNVRDGDLFDPEQADKYAITIFTNTKAVWRQIGTPANPPAIGGGNVTVKGK